jgi:small subunit ribosomal protein S8
MNDRKTDLLIRIKNAYLARHLEMRVPYFKLGEMIALVMEKNGYLEKVSVETDKKQKGKVLFLKLKYDGHKPALENIMLVSKPGVRIYHAAKNISYTKLGIGIKLISTSTGILTGQEAKEKNLGGEVIAEVW